MSRVFGFGFSALVTCCAAIFGSFVCGGERPVLYSRGFDGVVSGRRNLAADLS